MPGAVDYALMNQHLYEGHALANGYGALFLRLAPCGADPLVCAGPPGPALG